MTHDDDDCPVLYSRTKVLQDGSQQIEHFHLSELKRAFVDGVLGDPDTVSLISPQQADASAQAMGTYALIDLREM